MKTYIAPSIEILAWQTESLMITASPGLIEGEGDEFVGEAKRKKKSRDHWGDLWVDEKNGATYKPY